jgi:hypothetical protein
MFLLKVVHPLKIYQNTKFHGLALTGVRFASTSKVWTFAVLEWLQLRHKNLRHRARLQWHDLPAEFYKYLQIGLKVDRVTDS